eukprot:TRINITY_DN1514_c0_g1_i2.p1 TRINITY_DN1514_c0_g1~~TRINITY_DN1514_c0_g1_i2.p1  ORF type:complete len:362 (-),score=61.21 TRINITY_DN1514_c0_g1_i2:10-1095(-)
MAELLDFHSYSLWLSLMYLIVLLFLAFQLFRIGYYQHKIRSFQVGFLIQCFFFCILRFLLFFLLDKFLPSQGTKENVAAWSIAYQFVFWIPFNIQFSTFSLLVVYFAHILQSEKAEWRRFKRWYSIGWAIINIVFLIVNIVWITLRALYIKKEIYRPPGWLFSAHMVFVGLLFFCLGSILALYGYRTALMMKKSPTLFQTKLLAKISFPKVLAVSFFLFIIFTSRCIYDFVFAAIPSEYQMHIEKGHSNNDLFMFMAYFMWEIVTTCLVLVLFGKVSATSLGVWSTKRSTTIFDKQPRYSAVPHTDISYLPKAEMFNDPRRYDSDDETLPIRGMKSSSIAYGSSSSPVHPYPVRSINEGVR